MAGASTGGTAKVDGGVITFSRVRGGGCFGAAANRIELGTFSLPECADKVRLDTKCSPHFEWDSGNNGGVAGHGWCGCGAAGGNGCAGANEPGSSSAIYNVVFTPDSQWGFFFLLFGAIAVALYVGAGVALGRRQGRDAHSGGGISDALAVHPHYSHWCVTHKWLAHLYTVSQVWTTASPAGALCLG